MTRDVLITAAILFWVGVALNTAAFAVSFDAPWWVLAVAGCVSVAAGLVLSRHYYKESR